MTSKNVSVLAVCTAYESGFGHGLYDTKPLPNPYTLGTGESQAYQIGWDAGAKRRAVETRANPCPLPHDHFGACVTPETGAPQWQPIETAPKDGMRIILCAVYLSGGSSQWIAYWANYGRKGWTTESNWITDAPSYWMPLQSPPKIQR